MKRISLNRFFLLAFATLIMVACSEDEEMIAPLENNPNPPGQVSNVTVENLPGKAKLTYTLPEDQDLLYVLANYTLENGKKMEVKSSYYKSSVLLEGFAGTSEREVDITTVNRSEVASEPFSITVNPEEAPIWDVYRSMEVGPDFGGVYVDADNPTREDLAILIMEKDDQGDWIIDPNSVYTSTNDIFHTIRGMDTVQREFAFTVRDRWLNYTDTLFTDIAPLFETAIPKSNYRGVVLPGDAPQHTSTPLSGLWDGEIMNWPNVFLTQGSYQEGDHMFTFDMGTEAKLSRIVIWDYPEYMAGGRIYYYQGAMKKFEIYGTDQLHPDEPGNLDHWTLLGRYEETKPSGLPYGQQNNEDYLTASSGVSWDFPLDAPKVRYLRIVNKENWQGTKNLALGELQVYGDPR